MPTLAAAIAAGVQCDKQTLRTKLLKQLLSHEERCRYSLQFRHTSVHTGTPMLASTPAIDLSYLGFPTTATVAQIGTRPFMVMTYQTYGLFYAFPLVHSFLPLPFPNPRVQMVSPLVPASPAAGTHMLRALKTPMLESAVSGTPQAFPSPGPHSIVAEEPTSMEEEPSSMEESTPVGAATMSLALLQPSDFEFATAPVEASSTNQESSLNCPSPDGCPHLHDSCAVQFSSSLPSRVTTTIAKAEQLVAIQLQLHFDDLTAHRIRSDVSQRLIETWLFSISAWRFFTEQIRSLLTLCRRPLDSIQPDVGMDCVQREMYKAVYHVYPDRPLAEPLLSLNFSSFEDLEKCIAALKPRLSQMRTLIQALPHKCKRRRKRVLITTAHNSCVTIGEKTPSVCVFAKTF
jgi:hypothetical protein